MYELPVLVSLQVMRNMEKKSMKKILFSVFLAGISLVLAGDEILWQWRFTEGKVPDMQYPSGNVKFRIS